MSEYIVRPSAASQRFNCPGSLILEREAPPEDESEFAREGTIAHGFASQVLEFYFKVEPELEYELEPESVQDILDSIPSGEDNEYADMVFHVENYYKLVRAVEAKVGGFDQVYIEERVQFNEYMGGTADFFAVYGEGKKVVIIDLKYGQGVSVVAEENIQLLAYLLSAIRSKGLTGIESATMIIYQPRARDGEGAVRHWSIGSSDILAYEASFEEGVKVCKDTYYGDLKPVYSAGDHCLWCRAKPFCAEFKEDIKRKGVIALGKEDSRLPSPDKLTPTQIRDALFVKERITEFYRALEPYVLKKMENGVVYPGLKIVAGKSNRTWIDDTEKVVEELKGLGVETPLKTFTKLVGIGEAEKIVGKKRLGHITRKPPGKPKVVRDDDPRAEIHTDNPLDLLDNNVIDDEEF